MHTPTLALRLRATCLAIALLGSVSSRAQVITDPDSLSKNAFAWTQAERELGFRHMDEVFPARLVPHGDSVRRLPQGPPIAAFEEGGARQSALAAFITAQKIAGILILQDGKIRLERYAMGHNEDARWTSQSVAKSVTGTLVGAAIQDGYIRGVDDYLTDYLPGLAGSAYEGVTIHHLLTMTSGMQWRETYMDNTSDLADFFAAPIEPGLGQTVSYMRGLTAEAEPGEKWHYNTGETHLLGVLVRTATGKTLADYLSEKIWRPYGMEADATWLLGRSEQELGGCCLQMKLRDFGRFGQFVLEGGRINGSSIVPDGWFETATRAHSPVGLGWGYGYQWWTLADGSFRAIGIHGQMIHLDPPRRLVVVINSVWPEAENLQRQMAVENLLGMIAQEVEKE